MKKMIFGLAALASLATLATTVESSNTFGVLKLTSNDEETAICVPWVKVGTGASIDVDSLVLTSNLKAGDELYAFGKDTEDNTKTITYKWTLKTPGGSWGTSATTIGDSSSTASNASDYAIDRGLGLLLVRGTSKTGDYESNSWTSPDLGTTPIYLYGQYKATPAEGYSVTAPRHSEKRLSTLIAPPSTAATGLNTSEDVEITGAMEGDMIIPAVGQTIYYMKPVDNNVEGESLAWCVKTKTGDVISYKAMDNNTDSAILAAGKGAWYVCMKGTGSVTIKWKK